MGHRGDPYRTKCRSRTQSHSLCQEALVSRLRRERRPKGIRKGAGGSGIPGCTAVVDRAAKEWCTLRGLSKVTADTVAGTGAQPADRDNERRDWPFHLRKREEHRCKTELQISAWMWREVAWGCCIIFLESSLCSLLGSHVETVMVGSR